MIDDVLFKKAFSVACGAVGGTIITVGVLIMLARFLNRALDWVGL